jgi:hypothetical protein
MYFQSFQIYERSAFLSKASGWPAELSDLAELFARRIGVGSKIIGHGGQK